jgi:hypothetical protein
VVVEIADFLHDYFRTRFKLGPDECWWDKWTVKGLAHELVFGGHGFDGAPKLQKDVAQEIADIKLNLSRTSCLGVNEYTAKVSQLLKRRTLVEGDEIKIIKAIKQGQTFKSHDKPKLYGYLKGRIFLEGQEPKLLKEFNSKLTQEVVRVIDATIIHNETDDSTGYKRKSTSLQDETTSDGEEVGFSNKRLKGSQGSNATPSTSKPCRRCGWTGKCSKDDCWMYKHPDINKEHGTPFINSEIGKRYAKQGKKCLPCASFLAGRELKKLTEEQLLTMPKVKTFLDEQRKKQNKNKKFEKGEKTHGK